MRGGRPRTSPCRRSRIWPPSGGTSESRPEARAERSAEGAIAERLHVLAICEVVDRDETSSPSGESHFTTRIPDRVPCSTGSSEVESVSTRDRRTHRRALRSPDRGRTKPVSNLNGAAAVKRSSGAKIGLLLMLRITLESRSVYAPSTRSALTMIAVPASSRRRRRFAEFRMRSNVDWIEGPKTDEIVEVVVKIRASIPTDRSPTLLNGDVESAGSLGRKRGCEKARRGAVRLNEQRFLIPRPTRREGEWIRAHRFHD